MPVTEIAFSWNGLPQYGARLIRGALDRLGGDCVVIGSRPSVPVEGMEEALNHPINWIDAAKPTSWHSLGLNIPDVFLQSGWSYPGFSSLGAEVKAQGGRVIGLSDANWRGDFRQLVLGPIVFRAIHRRHFDAMIVPGRQGERLMRWFGMPAARVRCGMYGADPALFSGAGALALRPKTFLFVGQLIERKNVLGLARAFDRFSKARPDWTLHLCGSGEQRNRIPSDERIVIEDFVQPEQLAKRFGQARFLVLPSFVDAWGLVVHEAALCGCGLILSDRIGSADDLATSRNSVRFRAGSEDDLMRALEEAADFDERRLAEAEIESVRLAAQFGPARFGHEVASLIQSLSE
jgi:glycosyltransferase involved in cell wall biosynthesis